MTLPYNETRRLIDLALGSSREVARNQLQRELEQLQHTEPEFCAGVIAHGPGMSYTSDQWADFLSKVPNRLFRAEHWLVNRLSESQRRQLGLD